MAAPVNQTESAFDTKMFDLEKYADIFGKPKTGVHSYRIANIAIIDVLMTILGAWIISFYYKQDFWVVLCVLFLLGVFLHYIFGVNTTINKILTNKT